MPAGRLIWPLIEPVLDVNGRVVSGAVLSVFQNRTTTPVTLYADEAMTTPVANPQTGLYASNAAGRFFAQTHVFWAPSSVLYTLRVDRPDGSFDVVDDIPMQRPDLVTSTFGESLIAAADASAARTTLGIYEQPLESMVLNGEVLFDQVNEGAFYTSGATEKYGPDQWRFAGTGTAVWNFRRTVTAPPGFQRALQAVVTTNQATLLSTDNNHIEHAIEGYRIRKLKWGTPDAQPLTLQFIINSTVTGDYSLAFLNGTNTVFYLTTFNIPVAGAWTPITITIPGCTIGTWVDTSLFGLKYIWDLGWGSDFESSVTGAWTSGSGFRKPGTVALVKTLGAVLYIAAIQDDVGTRAMPFRYKPHGEQLLDLQRYFWKSFDQGVACANGAGSLSAGELVYVASTDAAFAGQMIQIRNPVVMTDFTRTVLTYNPVSANSKWRNESLAADSGTPTIFAAGASGFNILNPQVAGDVHGAAIGIHFSVNARLGGF